MSEERFAKLEERLASVEAKLAEMVAAKQQDERKAFMRRASQPAKEPASSRLQKRD